MKVSRVEEMRDLDRTAVEAFSIAEEILMENAGCAAFEVIHRDIGVRGLTFLVFCGVGNNGGDGLVVARKIHSMGGRVKIIFLGDTAQFKGPAKMNFEIISRLPIPTSDAGSLEELPVEIAHADVLIDALFGTGLTRNIEGRYREIIELINHSGKPVVSLDIPSGINGDTGQIMGISVRADTTITFGLPKIGNMLYPGYGRGGKLYITHISFPQELLTRKSMKIATCTPCPLPERDPSGHKGSFGDVLFISGSAAYFGAPTFSALSFLKAGGGYARLAAPARITPFIAGKGSEIVFMPMEETGEGSLAKSNREKLIDAASKADMVVIGPGLSLNRETQDLVMALVSSIEKPLLIDGDGITAVSPNPDSIASRKHPTVLTPHPGEMSRLTGTGIQDIIENRVNILQEQCQRLGSLIVLKGAHSCIGMPDGRVFINLSGNSGMATAGSGDVLTGTIAAMFGLGLSFPESVQNGVFLHGFAGDIAAAEKGEDGITAQDILEALPDAVRYFRNSYEDIIRNNYESLFVV